MCARVTQNALAIDWLANGGLCLPLMVIDWAFTSIPVFTAILERSHALYVHTHTGGCMSVCAVGERNRLYFRIVEDFKTTELLGKVKNVHNSRWSTIAPLLQ